MAKDFPKPDSIRVGPEELATPLDLIDTFTVSVTPASVTAASTAEQAVTVNGVQTGDLIMLVNYPARTNSTAPTGCRISANNTVQVQYVNPTAGALTPPSGNYTFLVLRPAKNY